MSHGGKRPGAGRPAGTINKFSKASREEAEAAGLSLPHAILLQIANGQRAPNSKEDPTLAQQIAAATAAAEYYAPKLARTELTGKDGGAIQHEFRPGAERGEADALLDGFKPAGDA